VVETAMEATPTAADVTNDVVEMTDQYSMDTVDHLEANAANRDSNWAWEGLENTSLTFPSSTSECPSYIICSYVK
jgi:hypothetical protein